MACNLFTTVAFTSHTFSESMMLPQWEKGRTLVPQGKQSNLGEWMTSKQCWKSPNDLEPFSTISHLQSTLRQVQQLMGCPFILPLCVAWSGLWMLPSPSVEQLKQRTTGRDAADPQIWKRGLAGSQLQSRCCESPKKGKIPPEVPHSPPAIQEGSWQQRAEDNHREIYQQAWKGNEDAKR